NAWWNGPEVEHAVRLTEPRLTLAPASLLERLPAGSSALDLDQLELAGEAGSTPAGAPADSGGHPRGPRDPGDEDDPAVILFTSGSTGLPKGAVLPHRALIALQHTLLHLTGRFPDRLPADHPREVMLQSGPLFHVGGIQGLLRTWLLGGTLVFLRDRFDPAEVVDLIETERVHRWGGVPTMVSRVLDLPGLDTRDLSSVRSLTLGGSSVAPELVERVRARFPNATRGISQIYGQSEAGGTLTAATDRDLLARPGTVGRALPVVELRIDDPGADGVGEVLARTPAQMSGYWGQPEDDPFTPDGWLRTGDLGHLDADGYLYLTGRSKDIIIRGGENIAAPHVESALLNHDQVRDVTVVGLPDPDLGEVVGAVVVVAPDSTVTIDELVDVARERLAYFAVPTRWWVRLAGLPVNATGKVDKKALQQAFPADLRTDERQAADPS
ncbi:MAG: class I adenylate-forming enzyme family protein, partial [Acidimicrobiia bacterium]